MIYSPPSIEEARDIERNLHKIIHHPFILVCIRSGCEIIEMIGELNLELRLWISRGAWVRMGIGVDVDKVEFTNPNCNSGDVVDLLAAQQSHSHRSTVTDEKIEFPLIPNPI